MFPSLSSKLTETIKRLRGRGVVTEADIDAMSRELRVALLEADVALPVVKQCIESFKTKAVGADIVRSINPAQMVVKLLHDHLVELLGGQGRELILHAPPSVVLMCGLQGSGKTTTTGKLALRLREKQRQKVLVASLDVYRPAAQEQLAQVARTAGVDALPVVTGEMPETITARALKEARLGGYDVLLLDTAGRLHIDDALMQELRAVQSLAQPTETLLVADALTGQDAVNIAKSFHDAVGVTGIILTRVDGDARGGAALSMRAVTGAPILFMGMGEKLSELEAFQPERVAGRILDMGDVVSLVEKASEHVSQEEAEKLAKRMQQGQFDLNDLLEHLRKLKKMGGASALLSMLPGVGALKEKLKDAQIDERMLARQEAIILSMTPKERQNPKLLNARRRQRIATGAGVQVQDVNRLMQNFRQMEDMMKHMRKLGPKALMKNKWM